MWLMTCVLTVKAAWGIINQRIDAAAVNQILCVWEENCYLLRSYLTRLEIWVSVESQIITNTETSIMICQYLSGFIKISKAASCLHTFIISLQNTFSIYTVVKVYNNVTWKVHFERSISFYYSQCEITCPCFFLLGGLCLTNVKPQQL